jgi:polar amino acid transport system substrate-binding protein
MPWNRVMLLTKNGSVAGSFPWNHNSDRIKDSYYSMPINQYRIVAFYKKGSDYKKETSLYKKRICLPSGWDISIFQSLINKMKMEVVSPTTIESCINMLAKSRVDIIFIDELVGKYLDKKIFGKKSPLVSREKVYLKKVVNLHFIVSRKYPNGKAIIERFNHGLERIKSNGVYNSIISAKSTCEICNQLGSL